MRRGPLTSVRHPSLALAYNTAGQALQAGGTTCTYSYSDQIKTINNGSHSAACSATIKTPGDDN